MTKTIKVVLASQILFLIVCNISFVKYSNAMRTLHPNSHYKKPKLDIVQTPLNNNNDPNKPSYNIKKSTHPQIWKIQTIEKKMDTDINFPKPLEEKPLGEKVSIKRNNSILNRNSGQSMHYSTF
ncbi:unnamed protein product [Meloidogyne enterolobii]|uniref:Uncharacterized protein n=1 Tax=Meloidogyne enterolobii TaxID=390850 RepID=A0ACB1AHZ1_MELEN